MSALGRQGWYVLVPVFDAAERDGLQAREHGPLADEHLTRSLHLVRGRGHLDRRRRLASRDEELLVLSAVPRFVKVELGIEQGLLGSKVREGSQPASSQGALRLVGHRGWRKALIRRMVMCNASAICLRLLVHWLFRAFS